MAIRTSEERSNPSRAALSNVYETNDGRMDEIWDLFLESNFLYPGKLQSLELEIAQVQRNLGILLSHSNDLLRTFVFRSNGRISGHQSALRVFNNAWLVQHLAVSKRESGWLLAAAALNVGLFSALERSAGVNWVRSYFRLSNKWPVRVLGDFARRIDDKKCCEVRTYCYLREEIEFGEVEEAPGKTTVRAAGPVDLVALEGYLIGAGREVELQATDLKEDSRLERVGDEYSRVRLDRRREVLVAERDGRLLGFGVLEISSVGLNLSELTNVFCVYMLSNEKDALRSLICAARRQYKSIGRRWWVALVEPNQAADFERAGFRKVREYMCVTLHHSLIGRYVKHVLDLYGRKLNGGVIGQDNGAKKS